MTDARKTTADRLGLERSQMMARLATLTRLVTDISKTSHSVRTMATVADFLLGVDDDIREVEDV